MARAAFIALLVVVGTLDAANALKVTSPSEGLTVVADRIFTVEWTGASPDNWYNIDLYYCGLDCAKDDCGDWVTALCPYAEYGCLDYEGNYDIVMPEPMEGTSGSGYKVRVMSVADESIVDCSSEFILIASDEAPLITDSDGPQLVVISPQDGDVAVAGKEYTVEFDYDNGVGSKVNRFSIDLYRADGGSGDCGTYVTSICDKGSVGCRDSEGDYDVNIPEDIPSGDYQIRVGLLKDDDLYGCSGTFNVVPNDDWAVGSFSHSYELWA